MSLSVKSLKNESVDIWDRFVDAHPEGTVFHKTGWLKLIDPVIEIIAVFENEEIKAGVALIKTKKNTVQGFHIPAYTQYFSPLITTVPGKERSLTGEHECVKLILDELKDAKHIDFKLPRGHQYILPYHWKGFESSVRITYIITDDSNPFQW